MAPSLGGKRDSRVELAAPAPAEARARWNSPIEFTITCIGYAVGLGNFWRFPFYCFTYGGGAFLVPYTLVLLFIGIPLFLLELGVGQKFQKGATHAWAEIHPALTGVGYSGVTATFLVALYYNILVAWALWFLANSFQSPLPWADTPSTAATNASSLNSTDLSHTDDGPPDAAARNASSWSWCAANATAAEREQARAVSFFEVDTLHCRPDNATTSGGRGPNLACRLSPPIPIASASSITRCRCPALTRHPRLCRATSIARTLITRTCLRPSRPAAAARGAMSPSGAVCFPRSLTRAASSALWSSAWPSAGSSSGSAYARASNRSARWRGSPPSFRTRLPQPCPHPSLTTLALYCRPPSHAQPSPRPPSAPAADTSSSPSSSCAGSPCPALTSDSPST